MSARDDDRVVVSLDPAAAEILLARLGWRITDAEAIDPYTGTRYRLTSLFETSRAVRRAVLDLAGEEPRR
jgi:hypothetical protein